MMNFLEKMLDFCAFIDYNKSNKLYVYETDSLKYTDGITSARNHKTRLAEKNDERCLFKVASCAYLRFSGSRS